MLILFSSKSSVMTQYSLWAFNVFDHYISQFQLISESSNSHPASRAFLNSSREKGLCRNRVKSLLNMSKPLLGDSFKPRPSLDSTPRRSIDFHTEGSLLTFTLSKVWCSRCPNRFDRNDQPRNVGCGDLKSWHYFCTASLARPLVSFRELAGCLLNAQWCWKYLEIITCPSISPISSRHIHYNAFSQSKRWTKRKYFF